MKIVSIKRLVLALFLAVASVMTLPAYAWPDTDEMNMCGAAMKTVRAYTGGDRGWAAHDNYIAHRGSSYYYRTNCPQSKATKNYKGKNWSPGVKMPAKHKPYKKQAYKHHVAHHGHKGHHKLTADCIRTDALNNNGPIVKKVAHQRAYKVTQHRRQKVDYNFYRQAQAVLNMSKVKHVNVVHNPKHKNHADCVRTDGLNNSGAIVRVLTRKHH